MSSELDDHGTLDSDYARACLQSRRFARQARRARHLVFQYRASARKVARICHRWGLHRVIQYESKHGPTVMMAMTNAIYDAWQRRWKNSRASAQRVAAYARIEHEIVMESLFKLPGEPEAIYLRRVIVEAQARLAELELDREMKQWEQAGVEDAEKLIAKLDGDNEIPPPPAGVSLMTPEEFLMSVPKAEPLNIQAIVCEWLLAHGYSGLHSDDCGCEISDLFVCFQCPTDCEPGHKVVTPDGHWLICETKELPENWMELLEW